MHWHLVAISCKQHVENTSCRKISSNLKILWKINRIKFAFSYYYNNIRLDIDQIMQFRGLILNKMILHMRVKFVENFLKMMTIHMLATAFYNSMENDIYTYIPWKFPLHRQMSILLWFQSLWRNTRYYKNNSGLHAANVQNCCLILDWVRNSNYFEIRIPHTNCRACKKYNELRMS